MDVHTTPAVCSRCLKTVSPVVVLDDSDLDAYLDGSITICRECLTDILDCIEEPANAS